MPQKTKNCFDKNLTFEKLLAAHKRARQHKAYKKEVIEFEMNLENNIYIFLNSINNNTYHIGKYYPSSMGVNFCGYRIFTTHKLLRLNSKKKIKKTVKHWNKLYENGTLDIPKTILSLNSWLCHSSHCNSYKLQNKIITNCEFLYSADSNYDKTEQYLISLIDGQKS